ncbi:MAG TPA: ABC transporter ATP-binding protein [Ktedonobacterales bacterium]|nr:ABC transporter ATP-binding protein [Ktedonobacterales bacterium]
MTSGLAIAAGVRLPGFTLDASFAVPPGLTVLFGPSGAGKSLLLQAIAGLMPLSSGTISLSKRVLADAQRGVALPPRQRGVGYVPQSYALFPHLTVAGNIAYALPAPRTPWDRAARAARDARVAELLSLVRLPGFVDRWPRQLSGGQQQRVALARALAADPDALLLDEPLAALDAPTRAAVQDDLRAVILASRIPALVVTHDLSEARALADRLVVLVEGRVVAEGPLADVLAAPPTAETALLLGWRNVLPIARVERAGACHRVTLSCGQSLLLHEAAGAAILSPGPAANRSAIALHADELELTRAETPLDASSPSSDGDSLHVTLRSVSDAGPFNVLRVALAGATERTDLVSVTCSHREWAALQATSGDSLILRVPHGAARLVTCAVDATIMNEESSHG